MTQLEDLKYARAERTPPADGAVKAMAVGKRRRRTRYAVAATLAALVAIFVPLESVLLSNSSSPPARPAPSPIPTSPKPVRYTAVGLITGYPTTNPHYCLTGDFATAEAGERVTADPCRDETTLRNVDARRLAMTAHPGGGGVQYSGIVRVTGTYSGGVLTLTQQPVAAKFPQPKLDLPIPCRAPAGGWKGSDPVNISQADEAKMAAFQLTHPANFGGWWLGRSPVPVIVVGVTSDVAGVQRELAGKLQGDVCVTKAAHTDRYLASAADEVTRLDMAHKDLHLSGWGASAVTSTVDVRVRIADPATRRVFAAHFPPGVIRLQPFLVQVR